MNLAAKEHEPETYIEAVLSAYLRLPETPLKITAGDRKTAKGLLEREVPLSTVQTALALGSLRRLGRPAGYPRLQPIRSLAYFLPVIDELLESPLLKDYVVYLREKLRKYQGRKIKQSQDLTGASPKKYVFS